MFNQDKPSKLEKASMWVTIIFAVITISLTFYNISLTSKMADYQIPENEVLIGSPQDDTSVDLGLINNISVIVTNNLNYYINVYPKVIEVYKDGEEVRGGYMIEDFKPKKTNIKNIDEKEIILPLQINKKGDWLFKVAIYYNYPDEENPTQGKLKTLELNLKV